MEQLTSLVLLSPNVSPAADKDLSHPECVLQGNLHQAQGNGVTFQVLKHKGNTHGRCLIISLSNTTGRYSTGGLRKVMRKTGVVGFGALVHIDEDSYLNKKETESLMGGVSHSQSHTGH